MSGIKAVALIAMAFAAACDGTSSEQDSQRIPEKFTSPPFACDGSSQPPEKLILHPNGVPNVFFVILQKAVSDVPSEADRLAQRYGGTIKHVYTAALSGFAVEIDPAVAPQLAAEPSVCWVEQDTYVTFA